MGVFKVLLSRALHICSEKFLVQEIKFLINIFAENGHGITVSERVTQRIYEQHYFCKTTMGTEIWTKVRKIIQKIWHKNHFYFGA